MLASDIYVAVFGLFIVFVCGGIVYLIPGEYPAKPQVRKVLGVYVWTVPLLFFPPLMEAFSRETGAHSPNIADLTHWALWSAMAIVTSLLSVRLSFYDAKTNPR